MMRQDVAYSINLESWPRHLARAFWTDGKGGEQLAQGLDHHEHGIHSRAAERLQLVFRLFAMNKIAHEHLQQDLVAGVEEFGDASCHWIGDDGDRVRIAWRSHERRGHWSRWLKTWILLLQVTVLLHDSQESAEVRLAPIAACSLPLLDNRLDGLACRSQVGDRDQFGPAEVLLCGLRAGRADEDALLAVLLNQVTEPLLNATVEVANGGKLLGLGHNLLIVEAESGFGKSQRSKFRGIFQIHPLGPLQVEKMLQGMVAKGQQGQLDTWRIVLRALGEVGMAEVGMGPDGGQQVAHQGEMQHLLGSNERNNLLPAFDRCELSCRHALVHVTLQTKSGEEIFAHDHMLKRRCFREHEDQLFAIFDHNWDSLVMLPA